MSTKCLVYDPNEVLQNPPFFSLKHFYYVHTSEYL